MTLHERAQSIARLGYTDRQARFLVTVMRHAGVCLPRQYAAYAGIVQGEKTRAFFAKLVDHGYAAATPVDTIAAASTTCTSTRPIR